MTDAQTWTAIIGLLTALLIFLGLIVRSLETTIGSVKNSLETSMKVGFDMMNGRFDTVNGRFDRLESRFDRLEARVDGLDRDVTTLSRRFLDGS